MISVNRGIAPPVFRSALIKSAKKQAIAFNSQSKKEKSQRRLRFEFEIFKSRQVKSALFNLFNNKCAYCETPVSSDGGVVDHFRPINGALGFTKEDFSEEHYWWLAYEWSNVYLSCINCSQSKGNRFPVYGERASIKAPASELNGEDKLLLDPCDSEDPGDHLKFTENGFVEGVSERGQTTISIFGLNRSDLLEYRSLAALKFHREVLNPKANIKILLSSKKPFSQLRRQLFFHWKTNPDVYLNSQYRVGQKKNIKASLSRFSKIDLPDLRSPVGGFKGVSVPRFDVAKIRVGSPDAFQDTEIRPAAQSEEMQAARLIEKVEIRNFKAIEELNISFSGMAPQKAPWKMLLGENGSGKTSILQAVALALIGDSAIAQLGLTPKTLVRSADGVSEAIVRVFLTGATEPITLVVDAKEKRFIGIPSSEAVTLFGYGATRLLGSERSDDSETSIRGKAAINLFNPREELRGVTEWMSNIDGEQFDKVARALKDILSLEDYGYFVRNEGTIFFKSGESMISLNQLSDGYQSLIAMTGHLMMSLLRSWPSLDVAEGIALIDEIGLHMHPRWKMRIVRSLRNAFPRVQFLCTSHDPLCLRGLEVGEVAVIERRGKNKQVFSRENLPPIESMKVDQILLSEHFGMNSTIDPDVEDKFSEYYRLLGKPRRSVAERSRVVELRQFIDNLSVLGGSRRERLALKVIDEYIAKESATLDPQELTKLSKTTKGRILKILDQHERT